MMIVALRIVGFLLTALSAVVLTIAFRHLWRLERRLSAEFGIHESIPLDLKARMILWAWILGLVVGIGLIVLSYQ
jgi:hypothetical protein